MEYAKMYVDFEDLERLVFGLQGINSALIASDSFTLTVEGVLHQDKSKSSGENAAKWIEENFDITVGVLRTTACALSIISKGFANEDIRLGVKE